MKLCLFHSLSQTLYIIKCKQVQHKQQGNHVTVVVGVRGVKQIYFNIYSGVIYARLEK